MEGFLTGLVAISAFVAAIAACMSYWTSWQSLHLQKNLVKNQNLIQKLNSILTKMESFKEFLNDIPGITDEEFESMEPLYLEIKTDRHVLVESGIMEEKLSALFSASSFDEAVARPINHCDEINHEIAIIKKAINKMLG